MNVLAFSSILIKIFNFFLIERFNHSDAKTQKDTNRLLDEYHWVIGKNTSTQLLYTSDHPVAQTKTLQQLH